MKCEYCDHEAHYTQRYCSEYGYYENDCHCKVRDRCIIKEEYYQFLGKIIETLGG